MGEPVWLAVVGKREAPGLNFRVLLREAAQALGAQGLRGFHLDGVDGTGRLHEEVHFSPGVLGGPVIGDKPTACYKLLARVLLGERPFEFLEKGSSSVFSATIQKQGRKSVKISKNKDVKVLELTQIRT